MNRWWKIWLITCFSISFSVNNLSAQEVWEQLIEQLVDNNEDIFETLETLKKLLPNEYKQCWHLWRPVYNEYIRIGYRLPKDYKED